MAIDRPIIMSGDSVRAILRGIKTATRRVIKPQPPAGGNIDWFSRMSNGRIGMWRLNDANGDMLQAIHCPYGEVGHLLWVRETWAEQYWGDERIVSFRADNPDDGDTAWRSALFMPQRLSRIRLKVIGVRIQRLHSITDDDLVAEGSPVYGAGAWEWFISLWDALNKRRGFGWNTNPWTWVIDFEHTEASHADAD